MEETEKAAQQISFAHPSGTAETAAAEPGR
jgi:hypothetical protein